MHRERERDMEEGSLDDVGGTVDDGRFLLSVVIHLSVWGWKEGLEIDVH